MTTAQPEEVYGPDPGRVPTPPKPCAQPRGDCGASRGALRSNPKRGSQRPAQGKCGPPAGRRRARSPLAARGSRHQARRSAEPRGPGARKGTAQRQNNTLGAKEINKRGFYWGSREEPLGIAGSAKAGASRPRKGPRIRRGVRRARGVGRPTTGRRVNCPALRARHHLDLNLGSST